MLIGVIGYIFRFWIMIRQKGEKYIYVRIKRTYWPWYALSDFFYTLYSCDTGEEKEIGAGH